MIKFVIYTKVYIKTENFKPLFPLSTFYVRVFLSDDVTEARVLQLQMSCLEQMQQRIQRQHEDQMKELMLQQSQELVLLEAEMEDIRRKAAASAMGHAEGGDPARVRKLFYHIRTGAVFI